MLQVQAPLLGNFLFDVYDKDSIFFSIPFYFSWCDQRCSGGTLQSFYNITQLYGGEDWNKAHC